MASGLLHPGQVGWGLWDARTRGYLGFVTAVGEANAGFAPGTSDVLIASVDGALSLWDPRPEAAVKAACQIAGRTSPHRSGALISQTANARRSAAPDPGGFSGASKPPDDSPLGGALYPLADVLDTLDHLGVTS